MVKPHPYLSEAWIKAARKRVEQEPALPKLVEGVSLSLLMVVSDRPGLDGEAVFIRFKEGQLDDVSWGERRSMEERHGKADYTIWATYATFSEIHAGTLAEKVAVLSGRVRLRGSMLHALRLLRLVVRLNHMLREVPAKYA